MKLESVDPLSLDGCGNWSDWWHHPLFWFECTEYAEQMDHLFRSVLWIPKFDTWKYWHMENCIWKTSWLVFGHVGSTGHKLGLQKASASLPIPIPLEWYWVTDANTNPPGQNESSTLNKTWIRISINQRFITMHVWWQWKTVHKKRWFTSYLNDTQPYCYIKLPEGIPTSADIRSYGSILRRQRGFGLRSARGQMQPGSGNCWAFGKPTSSLALGQQSPATELGKRKSSFFGNVRWLTGKRGVKWVMVFFFPSNIQLGTEIGRPAIKRWHFELAHQRHKHPQGQVMRAISVHGYRWTMVNILNSSNFIHSFLHYSTHIYIYIYFDQFSSWWIPYPHRWSSAKAFFHQFLWPLRTVCLWANQQAGGEQIQPQGDENWW